MAVAVVSGAVVWRPDSKPIAASCASSAADGVAAALAPALVGAVVSPGPPSVPSGGGTRR